jgi:hypothetical protein
MLAQAENAQTEESDKNDETRAEKEPDSTIKKVEADLVVVDNGEVELAEPAKNAVKLRKDSSVKAEIVTVEELAAV